MGRVCRAAKGNRTRERGGVTVEFMLLMPFMFMWWFTTFTFAMAFVMHAQMANVTMNAARVAAASKAVGRDPNEMLTNMLGGPDCTYGVEDIGMAVRVTYRCPFNRDVGLPFLTASSVAPFIEIMATGGAAVLNP